jgi:hypothetical protein
MCFANGIQVLHQYKPAGVRLSYSIVSRSVRYHINLYYTPDARHASRVHGCVVLIHQGSTRTRIAFADS